MKYLILIPDGMADTPIDALGGLTPMQKADKPMMDSLAARSVVERYPTCLTEWYLKAILLIWLFFHLIPRSFPRDVLPLRL